MQDETKKLLRDLHALTNNFSIQGEGVAGSLEEGYVISVPTFSSGPIDVPESPERPERSEQ